MPEDFHPAVQLMLARMETHPEEFRPRGFRWEALVASMIAAATPEEGMALTRKLNSFRMDSLHEQIMSELLEGPTPPRIPGVEPGMVLHSYQNATSNAIQLNNAAQQYKAAASQAGAQPPKGMSKAFKAVFK